MKKSEERAVEQTRDAIQDQNSGDAFEPPIALSDRVEGLEHKVEELSKKNNTANIDEVRGEVKDCQMLLARACFKNDLNKEVSTLEAKFRNEIDTRINKLNTSIANKADATTVLQKNNELSQRLSRLDERINDKADRTHSHNGSTDSLSSRVEKSVDDLEFKMNAYKILFCLAIIIFDILALWFIVYRPAFLDDSIVFELSWNSILPLIAILIINIICACIWVYLMAEEFAFCNDHLGGGIILGVCFFVFNIVLMWLFAFHPLKEVYIGELLILIFMTFSNIWIIFSPLYILNKKVCNWILSIFGIVLLAVNIASCIIGISV